MKNKLLNIKFFLKCVLVIFSGLIISISLSKNICYAKTINLHKKNVLVLHSYDESLQWTNDVSRGIQSIFHNHELEFTLFFSYMDMKKNYGNDYANTFRKFQLEKFKNIKFDLIICSDNDALEYLQTHGEKVFPKVPVIFTGINFPEVALANLNKNLFKGVVEEIEAAETINCILKLQPNLTNIKVFNSSTVSGKLSAQEVEKIKYLYKDKLNFEFYSDFTINQFLKKSKEWGNNTAVLFMADPLRDENNNSIFINECSEAIKNNVNVPIYSFWDFNVNHGVVGGKLISGFNQGKTAATLAFNFLSGTKFEDIPFTNNCENEYIFDYNFLKKFNMNLRSVPANGKLINKPFSFYETYKNLVLTSISIVIMLLITIMVLITSIRRKKRDQQTLNESYEELASVYDELSSTEEKLRTQYNELQENSNKVNYLAYYDTLTGLPNKLTFADKLNECIDNAKKYNKIGAVYSFDIDDFKMINYTLGHAGGDELLKVVASKITTEFSNGEQLFRFEGDEFLILKENVNSKKDAEEFGNLIMNLFNNAFNIDNKPIYISISMGIIIFPDHGTNLNSILKNVDTAMYKAKELGKNRYKFYDMNLELK